MREYVDLVEAKCTRCGKTFIPAPFHVYANTEGVWCSYTCYIHRETNQISNRKCKEIEQYSLDGKLLHTYPSASIAALKLNISAASIRQSCYKSTKCRGYLWKYKTKEKEQNK